MITFIRITMPWVLVLTLVRPLSAQRTPDEVLRRAVILYEELQLERAAVLLRDVLSPSNTATEAERVRAMTYLGATFALLGRSDSAIAHFRAALERDPFTDLDPALFTAQERRVFAAARQRTFVLGVRALSDSGFVPGRERVSLQFVTTQHARMHAVVRRPGVDAPVASFRWTAEGASGAPWDGRDHEGGRLPPGRYLLEVSATTTADSLRDTVALRFDLRYDHAPLEDTVVLDAGSLLPERRPPSEARSQLALGLAAAAFAVAVPSAIGHGQLGGTRKHGAVMAGVSLSGGTVAFLLLRRSAAIPGNVLENARRREEHARRNREIAERNAARVAEARMLIAPVSRESP